MKKGMTLLETIGIGIVVLLIFFILAYGFATKAKEIFSSVKQTFGGELLCERSNLAFSSYKGKFVVGEQNLVQEKEGTPKFLEAREKIALLHEEFEKCGFKEKIQLASPTLLALARYYAEKGNALAAIPFYELFLGQAAGKISADILNEVYRVYRDIKNHAKALAMLRRITQEYAGTKEGASAQYRLGRYYQTLMNDVPQAKEEYKKLLESPFFAELAEYEIAEIEFNAGKFPPYPSSLTDAQKKEVESLQEKASSLKKAGKYNEAVSQYKIIVEKYPNTRQGVLAQYDLGLILWKNLKQVDHAITELAKTPKFGSYGYAAALDLAKAKIEAKGAKRLAT